MLPMIMLSLSARSVKPKNDCILSPLILTTLTTADNNVVHMTGTGTTHELPTLVV